MQRVSYLAVLLLVSCARLSPQPDREAVFCTLDTGFEDASTRSLLTASDIETRRTEVSLAAYSGGALAVSGHFTTDLDAMVLDLDPNRTYTIYAFVNMGNITTALPLLESELSELTYIIPSYTEGDGSLAVRGLPMAGKLPWPGQGGTIPVQRLLAKVTADLSCEWDGAVIRAVRVCNLNRTLRPFGDAVREDA